jgi:hypothetical protein
LGASEACEQLGKAINLYWENDYVALWAVRAVADLAANNVNNQARLGAAGACEALVKILDRRRAPDVPPIGFIEEPSPPHSPTRKLSVSHDGPDGSPVPHVEVPTEQAGKCPRCMFVSVSLVLFRCSRSSSILYFYMFLGRMILAEIHH